MAKIKATVEDVEITRAVALSRDFKTYSMADRYRQLQKEAGGDFTATIHLLEHLPVFIDGDRHQEIRRVMAKQISKTKERQLEASKNSLKELAARCLRPGSEVELVSEFCRPLWRSISTTIVPRDPLTADLVDEIPALFSPILSIRERLKINGKIARFLQSHCQEANEPLILLCLATLGARPFAGSLALSLWSVFKNNPKTKTSEIAWPAIYPSSSLTYFDRIYSPVEQRSAWEFEVGDRVRCITQSDSYSNDANRFALFGFGAHTCLGKSIAEKVWTLVVEEFRKANLAVQCGSIAMSPHNDPFQMPAQISIMLK